MHNKIPSNLVTGVKRKLFLFVIRKKMLVTHVNVHIALHELQRSVIF